MFGKSKPGTEAKPAEAVSSLQSSVTAPSERKAILRVLPQSDLRPSVISDAVEFVGDLRSKGPLHVDGSAKGTFDAESVTVGSTGLVRGTVHCRKLHIKGRFQGKANCDELIITDEGQVEGSLTYKTILVQPGARVAGEFFLSEAT